MDLFLLMQQDGAPAQTAIGGGTGGVLARGAFCGGTLPPSAIQRRYTRRATCASSAAYKICFSVRREAAQLVVEIFLDFCRCWPKNLATAVLAPRSLRWPPRRATDRSSTWAGMMPSLARKRLTSSDKPKPTLMVVPDSRMAFNSASAGVGAVPTWNR